jgi:hypothetical protein
MSRERSDAIMADHGLPGGRHPAYEIDHLIPLAASHTLRVGCAPAWSPRPDGGGKKHTIGRQ